MSRRFSVSASEAPADGTDVVLRDSDSDKMVGHRWLSWINPTSGSGTSVKQEQETSNCLRSRRNVSCQHFCPVVSTLCLLLLVACVALAVLYNNESDSRPAWRSLLFDYQNISESYLSLTKANSDLRGDNDVLTEQSAWLDEQTKLLNRTSTKLMSVNLALSLESADLMGQIVNLTSTNLQLAREHDGLVRLTSEQEEQKLNMSQTIRRLMASDAQREQEERRLSEVNGLLRDELLQLREKNRELLEVNDRLQGEIKNLSEQTGALSSCELLQETVTELQQQNLSLSSLLMEERQEAAEREETRRNQTDRLLSLKEAYDSLDLYCPVVNHNTKERICKTCPDGWRLLDNRCYYFSSRLLTWSSSRSWCQTQGGDLLVIDSQEEQDFVYGSSRTEDQSVSRLWIGMTDAEEEGEWLWVDGSSVTSGVQFWLSRPGLDPEPDDWKLDNPLGEDCGHIDTSEEAVRSWMDASCKMSYRWICEKSV